MVKIILSCCLLLTVPIAAIAAPSLNVTAVGDPVYYDQQAGYFMTNAQMKIQAFAARLIKASAGQDHGFLGPDADVFTFTDGVVKFGKPGTRIIFSENEAGAGNAFNPEKSVLMQHVHSSGYSSYFFERSNGLKLYISFIKNPNGPPYELVFGRIVSDKGYVSFMNNSQKDPDLPVDSKGVYLLDAEINGVNMVHEIETLYKQCNRSGRKGHILDLSAYLLTPDLAKTNNVPTNDRTVPSVLASLSLYDTSRCKTGGGE